MYLKGRPISLRQPEGYEAPADAKPLDAPENSLKLDWVYPILAIVPGRGKTEEEKEGGRNRRGGRGRREGGKGRERVGG